MDRAKRKNRGRRNGCHENEALGPSLLTGTRGRTKRMPSDIPTPAIMAQAINVVLAPNLSRTTENIGEQAAAARLFDPKLNWARSVFSLYKPDFRENHLQDAVSDSAPK
jgi:hypothetical protein